MSWQDHYWVSSDGLRLHYRDYSREGQAQPILCLPGLSRNGRDFEGLADRLSSDWRIIVPSLRGRGRSAYAPDPQTYALDVYVNDLIMLLSDLQIDSAVVIGTSLGARLAMLMALRNPGLFAGAVLNDLGPETPAEALAGIRSSLAERQKCWPDRAAAIASIAHSNAATYPNFSSEDWPRFVDRLCRTEADGSVWLDFDPAISEVYRCTLPPPAATMWQGFDLLATVPVLSIRGALSTMLSPDIQSLMRRRASGPFMAATVPGVGHAPTLDEPESIDAIDALLDRVQLHSGTIDDAPIEGMAQ